MELPDEEFLEQIAFGLFLLAGPVDLLAVSFKRGRSMRMMLAARIVETIDEEPAKFLILVDAVCCDPSE